MDAEELAESIIRGLMFLAGILGNNWLAIRSIPRKKSGIHTNELLFINLAVSNLITNCLVDLPDTIADFAGRWFLGKAYCGVFRFCADLSETSSIFTTFFISIYWHQKLVGSLKQGGAPVQMDSLRLVGGLLAGSWTVAVVFSIPHFFFVEVKVEGEEHEDCVDVFPNEVAHQTYEILYLTLANAIPVAGIVIASVQIVITLLRNQRRIQAHSSETTKKPAESGNKSNDNTNNVCTVSAPGPSRDPKDPAPQTNVEASGLPSSPSPHEGLSGHGSENPPLNSEPNTESKAGPPPHPPRPGQVQAKPGPNSSSQVRAAKSVVAVASVFLVCWLTHLLLRITNSIHTSSLVVEVASYIAASYTCIIPYIFLHGVKKLSCSCRR